MTASRVVARFAEACAAGDQDLLAELLDADVTLVSDGGGHVVAPLHPVHGALEAARLVATLLAVRPGTELTVENINGHAGLVLRRAGHAEAVVGLDVSGSLITRLWLILNPTKLAAWHHGSAVHRNLR